QALNPWDLLAIRERERIEWTFNTFHYDVALSLVQDLRARGTLNPRWQALLSGLEPLIKAYMHWDRFEHKEIGDLIKTGIERLMLCKQAAEWSALTPFIEAVSENKRFYDSFREASGGFRPDRLCDWHLADLVGNARRRVSEGKYDDATARLYRALEMKAQLALLECDPPLNSSCVTPDQVPTKIRDEFTKRYQDERSGMLKLPLSGAYRLLLEVGHPAGNRFFENRGYFDKILSARNDSILAHGITVQRKDSCESFLKLLEPMLSVTPPTFPQIEFAESRVAVPG
ncbi:MAG TPA: TIGR02710 family CRISPR-associated CARF protein, partial [Candidatus Obscuribacterales bacterium]